MADQKYTNKYQKHWGVPVINKVPIYGHNQSYDVRASSGENKDTAKHASLHQDAALGRGHGNKPGGMVTRSKHHASHTTPGDNGNTSNHDREQRSTERVQHEQNRSENIVAEVPEKMQKQMMNMSPSVCTDPGKCQGGGELRLSHLGEQAVVIEIPPSYALVGCKSPLLPGIMLVAAVDKRYLPDEETSTTMLGFSGNCIGCGAKGFRYFTEFSQHINLRLATQPKKQKHMKYYIVKDHNGRLRRGNLIPWRVEGRKRSMPLSGSFVAPVDDDIPNAQSAASMASGQPLLNHPTQSGPGNNTSDSLTVNNLQSQSYNNQPAAKRHRWESGSDNESIYVDGENSPASSSAQDSSRVELPSKPWLTAACGVCPVLLLCQHSIPNVPCSVHDIIVSDLLVGCFDPPLVSDHNQFGNFTGAYTPSTDPYSHHSRGSMGSQSRYYSSPSPNALTTQMAILLLIQHLSQFDEDDRIMREEVESLLQDAQLELSAGYQHSHVLAQSNLLTHVQLPVLANLAAVSSKGRVKIITSPVSLDNAIVRGLKFIMDVVKHNQSKFPKVPMPDYIFMLSTSQKKAPEFCFLVSGIHQARYLTEAMIGHPVGARITDNLAKLEHLFRLSSDALEQMVSSYEEAMGHAQLVFVPFNGFERMKVMEEEALKMEPKVTVTSFQHYGQKTNVVYSTQNHIAKQLVAQVCSIAENSNALDVNKFVKVDLAIVVPPITTLFNQTIQKLANSGILSDLDLEEGKESSGFEASFNYVIKHDDTDTTQEKLANYLKKVQTQPTTLFILIFDQAQFYSRPRGVLDLPFYKEFLEATNVIPLFVTSAPYLFQTNCSFIDPENEVYWTDSKSDSDSSSVTSSSFDDDQYVDDQDSMYFGLKEYCDSIKWTHQFPLFRQDDAFERMALRTTRVTDDVNVSVLRCYLLIRHYCAAIMWSAGIKPAEPHCTLKTIQIIREIIECPVRNADGSGSMLVIRIPSTELAVLAFDSLKNVRDRLGFQYRFAVIHDNGMGELDIEDYFLKRLRFWKKQRGLLDDKLIEDWHPKCYEELLDLPCIILLSGRERTGETFPRSLKYIDIRLIDRGFLYRSSLELEFSAIACYISTGAGSRNTGVEGGNDTVMGDGEDNKDDSSTSSTPAKTSHYSSNYPLPVILVSRSAFKAFQTDFYGYPKHLLLPTTPQTRWTGHGRPHLVTSNPANQSLYYRKWTEPKPSNLVGTQCSSVNSRTVINMRSASGIVISPDIPDVVEEDGMSAVETMCETPRQSSGKPNLMTDVESGHTHYHVSKNPPSQNATKVAGSETEDNGGEDSKPNSPATKQNSADERETIKSARITHQQRAVPTAPSVASESDNETGAALTTDDESDSEATGSVKYHPRSILFSGLPQVGKTGAYLHFARLLHRMLIKQQKVDVYDEVPDLNSNDAPANKSSKQTTPRKLPDFETISKLPFDCELKEHQFSNTSSLSLYAKEKETKSSVNKTIADSKTKQLPVTRPVTSVLLSSWTAYDICHHCDSCKPYRDGMGPSSSLYYNYQLKSGEYLHFLIPPTHIGYFSFTDDKLLRSLKLPKVLTKGVNGKVSTIKNEGEAVKLAVKTPVMIPSTRRYETGLLNLYHAFEGETHTLLVFVKHHEMSLYTKMWPNHIIVGLPKESDNEGIGAAKYFIKQFATENFLEERERQGVDGSGVEEIWPMVLMMDDSCVMWQNLLRNNSRGAEKEETSSNPNTSLLKILETVESTADILKYGAVGFRQFSSKDTCYSQPSFSHCCLNTAVILNVALLQQVQYTRNKYSCEDLNFSLLLYSRGIPACRFNHLTVVKKRIEVVCKPTVKLLMNSIENSNGNSKPSPVDVNDYSNYVTAPDSEDTHYFAAPAEYLLEKYLVEAAARKLFHTAADNPDHPILAIDNYVNLGPRFTVEYVSTFNIGRDRKPGAKGTEKSKTKYGGLLLFFCDRAVNKEMLQQFDFIDDAQLCLVCQDRNTLRQEVVRLDLEEHWRFRLRDELQTANDPDEPSLFILTGKHE